MTTKLKNGAIQIERKGNTVLALWEGHHHPYVTWRINEQGDTYLGHYFEDVVEAVRDFDQRAN